MPDWLGLYKPVSNENYNGNPHFNRNLYFLHALLSCFSSLSRKFTSNKSLSLHMMYVLHTYAMRKTPSNYCSKCMSPGRVMNELPETPNVKAQKLDFQDQLCCNGPSDNW